VRRRLQRAIIAHRLGLLAGCTLDEQSLLPGQTLRALLSEFGTGFCPEDCTSQPPSKKQNCGRAATPESEAAPASLAVGTKICATSTPSPPPSPPTLAHPKESAPFSPASSSGSSHSFGAQNFDVFEEQHDFLLFEVCTHLPLCELAQKGEESPRRRGARSASDFSVCGPAHAATPLPSTGLPSSAAGASAAESLSNPRGDGLPEAKGLLDVIVGLDLSGLQGHMNPLVHALEHTPPSCTCASCAHSAANTSTFSDQDARAVWQLG